MNKTDTAFKSIANAIAKCTFNLESGFTFPIGSWDAATATRFFRATSPLTLSISPEHRLTVTNKHGQWLVITTPVVKAEFMANGYCYFVTESGHKYQFVADTFKNESKIDGLVNRLTVAVKDETFNDITAFHVLNRHFRSEVENFTYGIFKNIVNKPFGFVEDVYVSANTIVDADMESIHNKPVLVKYRYCDRGLRATMVAPFTVEGIKTFFGDKYNAVMNGIVNTFAAEEERLRREQAQREARHTQFVAEQNAKKARIASLVGEYTEKVNYRTKQYGGTFSATYAFVHPITDETFAEFIELLGHPSKAKPCYLPIQEEKVRITRKSDTQIDYYWSGEWSD